jgi:hypothetical protein
MGLAHAERVAEAVRRAAAADPVLAAFVAGGPEGPAEPFFVKNLERVQGDERDAIVLSVGYGSRRADGRLLHQFGPLNLEGGERRLNVAITRARRRMTVVSSFTSADLDPARLGAEGAAMLQRYLAYAEAGGRGGSGPTVADGPLDPFEEDVHDQLVAAGVPVMARYGAGRPWIDLVAGHPEHPDRPVLAIELDGPQYHGLGTTRDRDRLRPEHLARLGWRVHRTWSTDWWQARDAEVARLLGAWRAAVEEHDAALAAPEQATPPPDAGTTGDGRDAPVNPVRGARPPVPRGRPIGEHRPEDLVALVRWIEADGRLRTGDELLAEAMAELGFRRRGVRIVAALEAAIAATRATSA